MSLVAHRPSKRRTLASRGAGIRTPRAFTLVELIVVMAIIAALLTLALPRYFKSVDRAKEAVLRENLAVIRNALDQFQADTGKYPESLDELVSRRYLRQVPVDPVTESTATWQLQLASPDAGTSGIYDVRSGAKGTNREGKPYGEL